MKLSIVITLFLVILTSLACRPKYKANPELVAFNDFDSQIGWYSCPSNNSFIVEKTDAYSGTYATRININQNFGYIYKVKIRDLNVRKVSWVKYCSMFKKVSGSVENTSVICEISDSLGNKLEWIDMPLKFKLIERNIWTKVEIRFNLYKNFKPENHIAFFVWNKATTEEVIQDDIEISYFR